MFNGCTGGIGYAVGSGIAVNAGYHYRDIRAAGNLSDAHSGKHPTGHGGAD